MPFGRRQAKGREHPKISPFIPRGQNLGKRGFFLGQFLRLPPGKIVMETLDFLGSLTVHKSFYSISVSHHCGFSLLN